MRDNDDDDGKKLIGVGTKNEGRAEGGVKGSRN